MPRGSGIFTDDSKLAAAHRVGRNAEIDDVEDVEEFRAKLQYAKPAPAAMAERRVFDQCNIELMEGGAAKRAAPQSAEEAGIGPLPPASSIGMYKMNYCLSRAQNNLRVWSGWSKNPAWKLNQDDPFRPRLPWSAECQSKP